MTEHDESHDRKPGFLTRFTLRWGLGWVEWGRYEQEQPQALDSALEEFDFKAGDLPHLWAGCGA
jgi:hypothetical protein